MAGLQRLRRRNLRLPVDYCRRSGTVASPQALRYLSKPDAGVAIVQLGVPMIPYVFRAEQAISELDAARGDFVIVRPGDRRPVEVLKAGPTNYGLVLLLLETGALTPVGSADHDDAVEALRLAAGAAEGPAASPLRTSLRLLRDGPPLTS